MNSIKRAFRQYHRKLAIALSLPLILTVITGMSYTILDEWFSQSRLAQELLRIHSGSIFGLGKVYPVLNGLGLLGLLITGLSMTNLFAKRPGSSN
ncbi:MAG: peptidase [Leptolyngbyaceae bacterium]|nr:peptidase [Leptolyngbyaceae bacterium]